MKRKITILTIAFLSSVLMCANAFAAATGRCGDSIKWTLDDSGNLTLSGSGEMWNNGYDDSPFKDYEIRKATVKYGITSIGDYAFMGCSGLTELTLPNSVTSIGWSAFEGCSGLTELTLPSSVTNIGVDAFSSNGLEKITVESGNSRYDSRGNCNSIIDTETNTLIAGCKNSVIPNSVRSIGDSAFEGCSGLIKLTLPSSVTSIGNSAFSDCSGLTELTLPNGLENIGDSAFFACIGLTELTLPNSVKSIGDIAFRGCSGLTELTLPNSVTSIGDGAFHGCSGLTELILPNSVTSIGVSAFSGCSGLEKIAVESGNSCYDSRDNCNSIIDTETNTLIAGCKNSVIPNSVTSIGYGAFYGCSGLTELTLPNGVTSIGDAAFSDCSGLTELTLPNSVRSIGDIAFTYCSGLEKITVESGNSCYDSRDNCNSIIDTEFNTLIVGCKNSVIPNSVTSIGYYAFYGCSGLTELTLPNSVASIGDGAFICCSDLSKITSLAEIPPVCGSGVFDRVNKTNCELIVPIVSVTAYKQAEVWNEFSNIRAFPE